MNEETPPLCPLCQVQLEYLAQVPIRIGGKSGAWGLIFGSLADLGEALMPLDVYRCPQCGRVEFYDHDFSL